MANSMPKLTRKYNYNLKNALKFCNKNNFLLRVCDVCIKYLCKKAIHDLVSIFFIGFWAPCFGPWSVS